MNQSIRKKLENSMIPQYVLDYISQEINKLERMEQKVQFQEQRIQDLESQLSKKDNMLMQMYGKQGQQSLGYSYPGRQQNQSFSAHYQPWEEYPYYPDRVYQNSPNRGVSMADYDDRGNQRDGREKRNSYSDSPEMVRRINPNESGQNGSGGQQ